MFAWFIFFCSVTIVFTTHAQTDPASLDAQNPAEEPRFPSPRQFTPCLEELGDHADGRYPLSIALEFPRDAVRAVDPGRNMFCRCIEATRMVCEIIVRPGSFQDRIIANRLNRNNLERLRPFFIWMTVGNYDIETAPIAFVLSDCAPPVYAEIIVDRSMGPAPPISQSLEDIPTFNEYDEPPLRRVSSSPAIAHYPTVHIPPDSCLNQACPITWEEFEDHDVVYILRSDWPKLANKEPVLCISAFGLRQLANASATGPFIRDPMHRGPGLLTIRNDYIAAILFRPQSSCPDHVVVHPDGSISLTGVDTKLGPDDYVLPLTPPSPSSDIGPPPLQAQRGGVLRSRQPPSSVAGSSSSHAAMAAHVDPSGTLGPDALAERARALSLGRNGAPPSRVLPPENDNDSGDEQVQFSLFIPNHIPFLSFSFIVFTISIILIICNACKQQQQDDYHYLEVI